MQEWGGTGKRSSRKSVADHALRAERPGQVAWEVDGFSPEARYWRVRAPSAQEGLDTVAEIARIGGLP